MRPSDRPPSDQQTVRIRGRERTVIGRKRIGRGDYLLLERIGSARRERYLAFDRSAGPGGDFFQVQIWPDGPDAEQQLRLFRRLKDDSFPRVHQWQRRGGNLELVASWVEGISLADYFTHIRERRRPTVDPGHAVRLIHGLANAVCKLHHKQQVAHGDIQPANVIITNHPSRLVLIDFGSAWTTQTCAGRAEGDGHNSCYAAPELQSGLPTTGFLADQFSVSVLLYELLTGKTPYGGLGGKAGRPAFASKTKNSLIPPSVVVSGIRDLPRSLRESVDRLVIGGLALDPNERYPQRHAWLEDLYQVSAQFRLPPRLTRGEEFLTRVIQWFAGVGR